MSETENNRQENADIKDLQAVPLEELFTRLNQISDTLEQGEVSLEESFALYRRGMEMIQAANGKIDRAEKTMRILEEENSDEF